MITSEKVFDMLPTVVTLYDKLDIDRYRKKLAKENIKKKLDSNDLGIEIFKYVLKNSSKVKEDFFEIVAIFDDKTVEEVKLQSFGKTINSIKEIFSDKETVGFFQGCYTVGYSQSLNLLYSNYGITGNTKIRIKTITKLLEDAFKKEQESTIWDCYKMQYSKMGKENFISYKDYKSSILSGNTSKKSELSYEEIEEEMKKVENAFFGKEVITIEIFKLFGSILINNDAADKSLAKTDKKAEGVGTTLAKGIGTAAKWGLGLAAAAGTGMVALLGVATKASETTDRIDKLSNKIGISKKGFQEWDYILGQNGMDVEKLQVGVKTLVMQMGLAADGSKKSAESFRKLGVSWEDGNGKLKSQEAMMNESIMALANMENGTEKAKLATELFGKAGIEMMPMLNNGAEGITELKDRAHELGLVLSDEAVNSGVVLGDTIDDVKDSFSAIVTKIGVEVMPIVQNLLEWVIANMPTIQAVASVAFGVISNLIQSVGYHLTNTVLPAFNAFWEWLQPNLPLIQEAIQVAFDIIKKAISTTIDIIKSIIDWCIKYQEILIPLGVAVGAIALAFGIYTAAMAAWTVVTGIATGVGAAFGAVLAFITSPIGLVVLAIGALIAIGVLLYRNWDTIKEVAMNVFGAIGGFIGGIVDGIKGAFSGLVNGIIDNLNWIIGAVNGLSFDVPDWVPVIGGETFGFNIPTIPSFAVGTRYLPEDMLVQAHEGEMIVPKSENPYANTKTGETLPDGGGFTIKIENFINNRQQDVEAFAEELQFYMKQKAVGGGN